MSNSDPEDPISAASFIVRLLLDVLIGIGLAIGWMFFLPGCFYFKPGKVFCNS